MYRLYCSDNQLTSLNLTNCQNLSFLYCQNNQLTNLDISSNNILHTIHCNNNKIVGLDVSNIGYTFELYCNDNNLSNLILKNGSAISAFDFRANPNLTYICADSVELESLQRYLQVNEMTNVIIETTCTSNTMTHFQCYPSPAQNNLTIKTSQNTNFLIVNMVGEVVREITVKNKEDIDISLLPKGIYFLIPKEERRGISFIKD